MLNIVSWQESSPSHHQHHVFFSVEYSKHGVQKKHAPHQCNMEQGTFKYCHVSGFYSPAEVLEGSLRFTRAWHCQQQLQLYLLKTCLARINLWRYNEKHVVHCLCLDMGTFQTYDKSSFSCFAGGAINHFIMKRYF